MIKQPMHHILGGAPQILVSQSSFILGWEWKDKDYFSLNVTPNDMDWTVTIEDTGDGISWAGCIPASGSGDREDPNIKMNADEENTTGLDRYANVRFSDDSSEAADLVIQIMQEANPI